MNPPTSADPAQSPCEGSAGPADAAVLRLRGVTKIYARRPVLDRLDLDVPAGTVLGLLAKNGAGKTTLLKAALGLVRPQAGEIAVFGEPAWDLSAQSKSRLGYVPQVIQLHPWMKVRQILAYVGAFYPRWNHALVERLRTDWELPAEARVGPLSVGQLQKLAILLALGHEPELLVLDEPAASLDPAARRQFLRAVLDIASDGRRTVIFSTHITSDLERVADRVAILKDGRILYHGQLDDLKDRHKRLHVTAPQALPANLDLPGLIARRVDGAEALLTLRDPDPATLDLLRSRYGASVEVEDLNLEDIFLELHGQADLAHPDPRA